MATEGPANNNFETALAELEAVIEQLECGELSLEASLAAFEKGVGLAKFCSQKLSEVEGRVDLLLKDKEGKLKLKALDIKVEIEEDD